MKVIIIEDVEALAASLAANLRQLRPDVVISAIAPDTVSAIEAIRANPDTDLIFADIRLEDGYSFDVFDAIETNAVIVFITAYDEYALKAFDYECIDYLLKPYRKEDLEDALRRFEKRRADTGATVRERDGALKASPAFMKRLEIYRADSSLIVDVESICYAEYDLGSVHVYCKDRVSGTSSLSLTALAAALAVTEADIQGVVFLGISLNKTQTVLGSTEIRGGARYAGKLRKCGNHKTVPRGQHLIVKVQAVALLSHFAQCVQTVCKTICILNIACQMRDAPAVKIAVLCYSEALIERLALLLADGGDDLLGRECVIQPLLTVAVGILRTVKAAVGASQLT